MQKQNDSIQYSASDLVNYLECEHLTTLDLINLDTPLHKTEVSDEARLIQQKGYAHESTFLEQLKAQYSGVVDISAIASTNTEKAVATRNAMAKGYDIIFQATLVDGALVGHADFLRKTNRPSALGEWSYEVLDTKLARSSKGKFVVQLAFYSMLLAKTQDAEPVSMHVVLGNKREVTYRYTDYSRYLGRVLQRFLDRVGSSAQTTYPVPCDKCSQCRWSDLCDAKRIDDDHLSQVANISRLQVTKLETAGIKTLAELATSLDTLGVAKMNAETLSRLRQQSRLQYQARQTGKPQLELLEPEAGGLRGFARLPKPDSGDLFFDMEGDPLEEGGLEYLFGLYFHQNGKAEFKGFWAHSRAEEKIAFEQFMDFITAWLHQHPEAYIYHYAHYEQTALKKLMSLHGVREAEVDNLLRRQKLVDLYKVVREGIRVSEPAYSIKNIEHFYMKARGGDVKSAGASIVYYERWKETGDPQLLKDIENYNYDDVRSTYELREWLLSLRPATTAWATHLLDDGSGELAQAEGLTDAERRLVPYREKLVDPLPSDRESWTAEQQLRELTFQLLDFHRRSAKPVWWAMFARMDMTEEELLEDMECLTGLTLDPAFPPASVKRSMRYTYRYPEQESKLKSGDNALIIGSNRAVSNLEIDEEHRRVIFTLGSASGDVPGPIALGPGKPISSEVMTEAVFRFAASLTAGQHTYLAIEDFLLQCEPRIKGRALGAPIVGEGSDMAAIIKAIANLDSSYVFVQGPPGAGKTYTGSHVIVALLQQGFKVGISSNSHKAINNLLQGVEAAAKERGFVFKGGKKSDSKREDTWIAGHLIQDIFKNAAVQENWVMLATDLKVGERVRLVSPSGESVEEVLEVRGDAFRTSLKSAVEEIFVFGREVPDFRSVDYDAIAMLNVSATQELARRLETVQAENAALRRKLATQEQSMEARLIALERRMSGESAAKTVSIKTVSLTK